MCVCVSSWGAGWSALDDRTRAVGRRVSLSCARRLVCALAMLCRADCDFLTSCGARASSYSFYVLGVDTTLDI